MAENIKTRGFDSEGEFHYYLPVSQYAVILGEKNVVYGVVAATLLLVSVLACAVPAARAVRVDPNVALRSE